MKADDIEEFSKSDNNLNGAALSEINTFLHKLRQGFIQKLQLPEDIAQDFTDLYDQSKTIFNLDTAIRNVVVRDGAIVQLDKKEFMNFPLPDLRDTTADMDTLIFRSYRGNHKLSQIILNGFSTLLKQSGDNMQETTVTSQSASSRRVASEEIGLQSLAILMEPIDDQSLYSFFHYKDGASVTSHEDRGANVDDH